MASGRKGSADSESPVFASTSDLPRLITPSGSETEIIAMAPSASEGDMLQLPHARQTRLYSTDTTMGDMDVPHLAAQMANTRLENLSLLDIFSVPHVVRNTGLVCTIGGCALIRLRKPLRS